MERAASRQPQLSGRMHGDRGGRVRGDAGYTLLLTAFLIIPILGVTAIAIDVGAWYGQAAKMQRAADLASMAAVVWLPNTTKASQEADKVLQRNGFTSSNAVITKTQPAQDTYQVTVNQSAPLYFGKLFKTSQTLTRGATAQFNKPVPLGSPSNSMGNTLTGFIPSGQPGAPGCVSPVSTTSPCPNPNLQPQLWAAIQGPITRHQDGDPYTTKCAGDTESTAVCNPGGVPQNTAYRAAGYLWAVDVPASMVGQTVKVQIYDGILGTGSENGGNVVGESSSGGGFDTIFDLYDSDGSDLTVSTDASLKMSTLGKCNSGTTGSKTWTAADSTNTTQLTTYKNKWFTLCQFQPTKSGIHPLQVRTTGNGGGYNAYSIKATNATGGASGLRTYALNDMSLWNNAASTTAKFYLAEVGPEHAGKKLVLDLYDPGDGSGSGTFTMQFLKPPGGPPTGSPATFPAVPGNSSATTDCYYNSTKFTTLGGGTTPTYSSTCSIITRQSGTSKYNEGWLRVVIQIPANYSCPTYVGVQDCWWSVKYQFGGTPTDRTVWAIQIVGDPVHLIG